jgi:hypothetical protein
MRSFASAGAGTGLSATTTAPTASSAATKQDNERLGTGRISQPSPQPISRDPGRISIRFALFHKTGNRKAVGSRKAAFVLGKSALLRP